MSSFHDSAACTLFVKTPTTGAATHIRLTTSDTIGFNTGVSVKFALTSDWTRIQLTGDVLPSSSETDWYFIIGAVDETGAADADCVGDIHIFGSQAEDGPIPTSYIVTTTAAVTRNLGFCDTTDVSAFNETEGTIFVEGSVVFTDPPIRETICRLTAGIIQIGT